MFDQQISPYSLECKAKDVRVVSVPQVKPLILNRNDICLKY